MACNYLFYDFLTLISVNTGQFEMLSPVYTAFLNKMLTAQQLVVVNSMSQVLTSTLPARLPHGPATSAGMG
jgi:hypothetical protein